MNKANHAPCEYFAALKAQRDLHRERYFRKDKELNEAIKKEENKQ